MLSLAIRHRLARLVQDAARAAGRGVLGGSGALVALALGVALLLAPLRLALGQATTPSFAAHADFAVGANPRTVAAADVNGDGKPDLLVANDGSDTVSVLL